MEFGHYSRLEQLQRRLWYFSYLKYPISSLYHLLANSALPITSAEQPTIHYSRPCSGCLRCQPTLIDQYRSSVKEQEVKSSFFSRLYQSNRSSAKAAPASVPLPTPSENPDCGVEYALETGAKPMQLWVKTVDDPDGFQLEISDRLERFNYEKEKWAKQASHVRSVRFQPTINLLKKHFLINQEKSDAKKENDDVETRTTLECRIELSEKPLKFIQINPETVLNRRVLAKPTTSELEEAELEKKGIFLFSRRHRPQQSA